jgi:hypothetical protein
MSYIYYFVNLLVKNGLIVRYNFPRNIKEFIITNIITNINIQNPFDFINEIIKSIYEVDIFLYFTSGQ